MHHLRIRVISKELLLLREQRLQTLFHHFLFLYVLSVELAILTHFPLFFPIVEFTGSRSPLQQLQPRERDRGAQERERDQQTRGREAERNYDDPPRYRHSPPHLPAGVSDSKERDFDREIERDRPRRSDRSDSRWANGPSTATKTQDVASHLRSRESDKPVDTVTDRRDGVFDRERDKERERGRGLERDSDRGRPEPLPEGTSHSRQRLPDRHPPGSSRSNADDTQRRSGEDNNSASGEVSSNRMFLAYENYIF